MICLFNKQPGIPNVEQMSLNERWIKAVYYQGLNLRRLFTTFLFSLSHAEGSLSLKCSSVSKYVGALKR